MPALAAIPILPADVFVRQLVLHHPVVKRSAARLFYPDQVVRAVLGVGKWLYQNRWVVTVRIDALVSYNGVVIVMLVSTDRLRIRKRGTVDTTEFDLLRPLLQKLLAQFFTLLFRPLSASLVKARSNFARVIAKKNFKKKRVIGGDVAKKKKSDGHEEKA